MRLGSGFLATSEYLSILSMSLSADVNPLHDQLIRRHSYPKGTAEVCTAGGQEAQRLRDSRP